MIIISTCTNGSYCAKDVNYTFTAIMSTRVYASFVINLGAKDVNDTFTAIMSTRVLLSIQIASATLSARMEAVADTARNRLGLRQNGKLMY